MAGGIIQLVAYGIQDVYLTHQPEITFFKIIYRRYTNFAMEAIPQYFDKRANFGESVSCTLSRAGDLAHRTYLCVTLPTVPRFYNQNTNTFDNTVQFAWCKKIGFVLIKTVSVEIGGQLIDKHFGDWMCIWAELTGKITDRGLDVMIGNVPELYEFSSGKSNYKLFIPLLFWFCRHNGLALPMIALQYNEVKINIEFRKAKECYIVSPSHSYDIIEDICSFTQGDLLTQTINGKSANSIFMSNDPVGKNIKYLKIPNGNSFTSATILKSSFRNTTTGVINNTAYNLAVGDPDSIQNLPYHINNGETYCTPIAGKTETTLNYYNSSQFAFVQAFLLVDYIYLDNDERQRFARSNHEYMIEQLQIAVEETVSSSNASLILSLNHPIKELYWTVQLAYLAQQPINDHFNYTTQYQNDGISLVREATILLNGQQRISLREGAYFGTVQPYQHHSNSPAKGISSYSFAISPESGQPTGTCNMSRIDNINLALTLNTTIGPLNQAIIRSFGLGYNILRIINGLGGIAFIN